VPRIAAVTDAVINITTGGSIRMAMEERLAYPLQAKPAMFALGEPVNAKSAVDFGLANRIVLLDSLPAEALAVAERIQASFP
jgi:enoyl-CoA hydratase/carnithine racemase